MLKLVIEKYQLRSLVLPKQRSAKIKISTVSSDYKHCTNRLKSVLDLKINADQPGFQDEFRPVLPRKISSDGQ